MTRGRFITFEGGEGVGKSTQARLLVAALQARGADPVFTREPGGTPGAEAIRALLLDNGQDWTVRGEALLFAAARAEHVARVIRPALEAGQWVLCDRFIDSSRAYQGGGGGAGGALSDEDILALHEIGSGGLMPDVTFLLQAPEAEVSARLHARDGDNADRIGSKDEDYHARVAQRFRALAALDPGRFVLLDASGTPQDVHARILAALGPLPGQMA